MINPEGTGDYPTIQQAIDAAAPGDTVALADGTYVGDGNRDLDPQGKSLVILSVSDSPSACVIDGEGTADIPHRGFFLHNREVVTIRGLTVRHGAVGPASSRWDGSIGAAVRCGELRDNLPVTATAVLENCVFSQVVSGAAVAAGRDATAVCRQCVFTDNRGDAYSSVSGHNDVLIDGCRFDHNDGSGVITGGFTMRNTSFLYNGGDGVSLFLDMSIARLENCVLQGNGGNGVALRTTLAGSLWLADCEVLDNGGYGIDQSQELANVTLEGCRIAGNARGGLALSAADCVMTDTDVMDNPGNGIVIEGMFHGVLSIDNCRISGNKGFGLRAANSFDSRIPSTGIVLSRSVISHNDSTAVMLASRQPLSGSIVSCTIAHNGGAGVSASGLDSLDIERSILALNGASVTMPFPSGSFVIGCTDIFGSASGDWIDGLAEQLNLRGNFSADPCFCDTAQGDYHLSADSWCPAGHHPWGCDGLVGALGEGCPAQGCPGGVPVLVTEFAVRPARESVEISWRANGVLDAARLRVLASGAGHAWDVPIQQGLAGRYTAIDRNGPAVLRSAEDARVVYALQLANDGGWTVLGRQELSSRDLPGLELRITAVPNPFNPTTTLRFDLPAAGPVKLSIFDVGGRLLRTLVGGSYLAGSHQAIWDGRDAMGRDMGSGAYFARVQAGGKLQTVRMSLVR